MGFFDFLEDNCLPGDPSFDDLYGGNQSGMFPDEEHFFIDTDKNGITLQRATFTNAGCGNWNTSVTAVWKVEHMSRPADTLSKGETFTLKAEGDSKTHTFKVSTKFNQSPNRLIVDMIN